MKPTQFTEISTEYTDENGVLHIDGYTLDEESGHTLAYVFNKEVYYTNPEYRYDSFVGEVLKALRRRGLVN